MAFSIKQLGIICFSALAATLLNKFLYVLYFTASLSFWVVSHRLCSLFLCLMLILSPCVTHFLWWDLFLDNLTRGKFELKQSESVDWKTSEHLSTLLWAKTSSQSVLWTESQKLLTLFGDNSLIRGRFSACALVRLLVRNIKFGKWSVISHQILPLRARKSFL